MRAIRIEPEELLLYAVTDRQMAEWGNACISQVEAALKGGATFIQLREKESGSGSILSRKLLRSKNCVPRYTSVPFVINDNVELAQKIGCRWCACRTGGHGSRRCQSGAGSTTRSSGCPRRPWSRHNWLRKRGADYLGVGAVFPTGSKNDATEVSFETLQEICEHVHIPVIAIGGITRDNVCGIKSKRNLWYRSYQRDLWSDKY